MHKIRGTVMNAQPENWIKYVESVAIQAQDIPMWGTTPSFPWKAFTKALNESIETKKLKILPGKAEWKIGSAILKGMGRSPLQLAIELSPLKGHVSLIFPSEDFAKLSSWAIHPEGGNEGFSDPYLQKGFFRFLSVEAISVLEKLQAFQGLALKLIDAHLEKEDAYCIDIAIEHEGETIWGRLICPTPFQESFKHHYARDWDFSIPSHLYEEIFVDLSLTAGETKLSQDEWKKIREGDFVIMDHSSYYPKLNKGTFQLKVDNTPLFLAKVKEDSIKLLDYAHYFEENTMEDEKIEDTFEEPMEQSESASVSVEEASEPSMASPKSVPISLTVEVARIKMNLDKLLKLKPGNILELGIHPQQGVNLIANGKCMGKGELLQIGDTIGVKITKLGE